MTDQKAHSRTGVALDIAIIGSGVAGASAARQLARSLPARLGRIAIHEIGRGPGGRAATRKSRSLPGFRVNHGAPYADITTAQGQALIASLEGAAEAYTGERVRIDARTGRIHPLEKPEGVSLVTGAGGEMARIAEGLLRDQDGGVLAPVETRFTSMVRGLSREPTEHGQWQLTDRHGETIGQADWLVVAGSGVAHPRWSQTFGGEPPLVSAAQSVDDPALEKALAVIAGQGAAPVLTVFFHLTGEAAEPWLAMGLNDGVVEGDRRIARLSVQPTGEGRCSVVLYSTREYARENAGVHGASSSAARVGNAASSADREAVIIEDLLSALTGIPSMPAVDPSACAFGPLLHRWGNAFPLGEPLPRSLAVCPDARVAFCGDYVATDARMGSYESALLSGANAAEAIREALG
ncbi:NAD(P)-binding protein [Spiribacter sp. 221]|uniref:NAD(P)-binding protein n=1 Tax=Spiribacter onubensis TaxID=3122420 RepID=UPI00349F4D98